MAKITNNEARSYVMRKENFDTVNETMFAKTIEDHKAHTYTVYSYGHHFPMYVYDYKTGEWYGNKDKFSRTTSKHQSIAKPHGVDTWFDTKMLNRISLVGLTGLVEQRLAA